MKRIAVLITALMLAPPVYAGGLPKHCVRMAQLAPNVARAGQAVIDPLALCHRERARINADIRTLRSQIAGAQQQLAGMSGLSFMCVDETTSRNSKGVSEDCWPNRCGANGRCIVNAASSADCAGGTVWDSSTGDCIVPPPPSDD